MTTPWKISEDTNYGFEIGIDSTDIYRNYDSAMVGMIYIPRTGIDYHWNRDELALKDLDGLKAIAASRNLGAATDTDNRRVWEKIILNSQRVPVHFSSAAVGWGGQQYSTGEGQPITVEDMVGIPDVRFPAVAVVRTAADPALGRDVGVVLRKVGYWRGGEVALQANKPTPINFQYQVDTLALQTRHANKMQQWFVRAFHDDRARRHRVRIEIDHGEPWGMIPVYIEMTDIRDTSQLTGAASSTGAEKLLRHTFSFQIEGWLPGRVRGVPTVQRTTVTVREGTPDDPGEVISEATLDPATGQAVE